MSSCSTQWQTVLRFWKTLDTQVASDFDGIMTEDFSATLLPSSTGLRDAHSREEAKVLLGVLGETIKKFNLEATEIIEMEDVIVARYRSNGTLVRGGPYLNEYMGIFRFKGDLLRSLEEMMDSKYISEVMNHNHS